MIVTQVTFDRPFLATLCYVENQNYSESGTVLWHVPDPAAWFLLLRVRESLDKEMTQNLIILTPKKKTGPPFANMHVLVSRYIEIRWKVLARIRRRKKVWKKNWIEIFLFSALLYR